MNVPEGTKSMRSSPPFPPRWLPEPASPHGAENFFREAKTLRVSVLSSATIHTAPPFPPSPPSGPPIGSYFSRRQLTHPRPPFPPRTVMVASSRNMDGIENREWTIKNDFLTL